MPRESKKNLTVRTACIIARLKELYPDARTVLHYSNPVELLVATILSAQCSDRRVNTVTAELFRKYKSAGDYARASQETLENEIRATGFYRNKAKNIRAACARIAEEFAGKVPGNMADLLTLRGVARKTANVVLGDIFGRREGIVVDTHVIRLSGRLKLTRHEDNQGDRIEKDLIGIVEKDDWTVFAHLLTYHGRQICSARRPDCQGCVVNSLCPSALNVRPDQAAAMSVRPAAEGGQSTWRFSCSCRPCSSWLRSSSWRR